MSSPTRRELLARANTEQMNNLAHSYGFPSYAALQTVIQLASHVQSGGRVTDKWVDKVAAVYPAVPRETLAGYANQIRTVDDLAHVVGIDPATAKSYVRSYDTNSAVQALNARREENAPKEDFMAPVPLTAVVQKQIKDNPPGAIRAAIEKAAHAHEPNYELKDLPSHLRREITASGLEHLAARRTLRNDPHVEAAYHDDPYGADKSRRGDITMAYDQSALMEQVEHETSVADLEQPEDETA